MIGTLTMMNSPSTPDISNAVGTVDLAGIDAVSDVLSDAGDALAATAVVARRRSARVARGAAKLGARGGSVGARVAYRGARAAGRGMGRGAVGSARVARRHPKVSAGAIAALLALIAVLVVKRRSSAVESSSDAHLAAVA